MAEFLIVVDEQNDFMPKGALPVPKGDEVVAPTNIAIEYAQKNGMTVIKTRDWHPADTKHFEKWPPHCVQNTKGASFHPNLLNVEGEIIISKGTDAVADGYSAFEGTAEDGTTLEAIIQPGDTAYIAGLATDYCVLNSVMDAALRNIRTVVLLDACRGINSQTEKTAIEQMRNARVTTMSMREFVAQNPS